MEYLPPPSIVYAVMIKQVRIQDLCKEGGGGSEILLTSRSGVAVAAKIWASKLGVGGGAGS